MFRMSRDFELGLRGRVEDVDTFAKEIREPEDSSYWSGKYKEDENRSFQNYGFGLRDELNEDYVADLVRKWSLRFPEGTAYGYLRAEHSEWDGDHQHYIYLEFQNGDVTAREEITTHAQHKAHFGTRLKEDDEESKCACETRSIRRNPLRAPYGDCPPRSNPSTHWAVENIMMAHEMIGRRK